MCYVKWSHTPKCIHFQRYKQSKKCKLNFQAVSHLSQMTEQKQQWWKMVPLKKRKRKLFITSLLAVCVCFLIRSESLFYITYLLGISWLWKEQGLEIRTPVSCVLQDVKESPPGPSFHLCCEDWVQGYGFFQCTFSDNVPVALEQLLAPKCGVSHRDGQWELGRGWGLELVCQNWAIGKVCSSEAF